MPNSFSRRKLLQGAVALGMPSLSPLRLAQVKTQSLEAIVSVQNGPFQPNWESLSTQQTPEWFQDAKLGLWAHWTAQCVPEQGDWYARSMYIPYAGNEYSGPEANSKKRTLNNDYEFQCQHYGHPSYHGFKDVDHLWHAQNWNPHALIQLYKRAGAKYFVALANHHDNFDCFNSKYQPWNAVNMGPKRDIVGTWAETAREAGLKFGVTVHAARTWSWYEVAQGADPDGPFHGMPYDGKMTKADGKGLWWDGYDPQDLYAQNHAIGAKPDKAYCDKFFNRVIDLIDYYHPDLLYFDDYVMPLYDTDPSYGLRIASHYYNSSAARNGGKSEVVMTGKNLNDAQRKAITWDIERGLADKIEPFHWQTDTCIGDWHYSKWIYDHKAYKTSKLVIHMLIDIISKNGNLLLNIPVKGDGTIDSEEHRIVTELGDWMEINHAAIHGTRPWGVYGEGPDFDRAQSGKANSGNFNEGSQGYSSADVRYVTRGSHVLYAFILGWPTDGQVLLKSLANGAANLPGKVKSVHLLGDDRNLVFEQTGSGLKLTMPNAPPCKSAYAFKINF